MNYFFITGTGRGLGKAIALELLNNSKNRVVGLSRTNLIENKNFRFIKIDLQKVDLLNSFVFPEFSDASQIVLINNAGTIGQIKVTGRKNTEEIIKTFQLNTVAPSVLINQFIKQFQNLDVSKLILNISSGAGRHTVASWSEYCASKSALDMYSMVVDEEQKKEIFPFKVFSVAPGVIDTDMQGDIRSANEEGFEMLDYFKELKEKNSLSTPEEIAKRILSIIDLSTQYKKVLLDVREL